MEEQDRTNFAISKSIKGVMVVPQLIGYLGNQMFQIAAAIGYNEKYGGGVHIPDYSFYPQNFPAYFDNLQNKDYRPTDWFIYNEPAYHYTEIPNVNREQNILLKGYFQSEKYFDHCKEKVKKAFGFKYEKKENTIAIHVRRGDYLLHPTKHPVVDENYVMNAMRRILDKINSSNAKWQYVVFSDDLTWCIQYFDLLETFYGININYCELNDQKKEMELMMGCEHIICSNSSFSWWGAWLNENPNKIVVMPKNWFGPDYANNNTKDLYLKKAIIL